MLQIERLVYPLGKQLASVGEKLNEVSAAQVNRTIALGCIRGFCCLEMTAPVLVPILLQNKVVTKEMLVASLIGGMQLITLTIISIRPIGEALSMDEERLKISTHVLPLTGKVFRRIGHRLAV